MQCVAHDMGADQHVTLRIAQHEITVLETQAVTLLQQVSRVPELKVREPDSIHQLETVQETSMNHKFLPRYRNHDSNFPRQNMLCQTSHKRGTCM